MKSLFRQTNSEKVAVEPCTHTWNAISKTYAPPARNLTINITDVKVLEKALFGVTTYIWECQVCSALRSEQALGSDTDQLAQLIEKVDTLGMQYIKEGNNTYAIAKVPSDTDKIPVR